VFRDEFIEFAKHAQLHNDHRGKQSTSAWKLEVNRLRKRMDRAASRDDFEKAAELKAEIQRIEGAHVRAG
jgi:protein-arginine kinase activator protein McsA